MRLVTAGGAIRITTAKSGLVSVVGAGGISSVSLLSAIEVAWLTRSQRDPSGYLAMLVDLSAATLPELDYEQCKKMVFPSIPGVARVIPIAFIVPVDKIDIARSYCMHCATLGAVTGAFTLLGSGLDWVLARAKALQDQHQRIRPERRRHRPDGAVRDR